VSSDVSNLLTTSLPQEYACRICSARRESGSVSPLTPEIVGLNGARELGHGVVSVGGYSKRINDQKCPKAEEG
jgi:hypothetical protein